MHPAFRASLLTALFGAACALGQGPPKAPDELREMLKLIEKAHKAPLEADKDVLDELRKQYRDPTPEREAKIFREIQRAYQTTPELEEVILREIRAAYQRPTAEQEERVFAAIHRGGQLPPGTVPASIQAERAEKLFRKLDRDGDGVLRHDEIPDGLRRERARWDANRDGSIDLGEYSAYFAAQLKTVTDGVASGDISLHPSKPADPVPAAPVEKPRATVARPVPGLPDWFHQFDIDGDGQVGLYEWRQKGGSIKEFVAMDQNGDGFLTAKELLAYLAEQAKTRTGGR